MPRRKTCCEWVTWERESAGQVTVYPAGGHLGLTTGCFSRESTLIQVSLFPHTLQTIFSRNPLPAACHRCELLQSEAKGWEGVCTRVFVHLCVPLSLNLCLCTQVCVYAGQCVLVSLNSYMCPCVCVHLYDKGPGVSRWAAPPPTGLPPSQGLSPTRQRQELKLTSQRLCLVIYL